MDFTGVTFFIGYMDKGQTKEARCRIDNSVLEMQARKGSKNLLDFLRRTLNQKMVEEILREFLHEIFEREADETKRREIFGEGPLTKEKMEAAVQNLINKRR